MCFETSIDFPRVTHTPCIWQKSNDFDHVTTVPFPVAAPGTPGCSPLSGVIGRRDAQHEGWSGSRAHPCRRAPAHSPRSCLSSALRMRPACRRLCRSFATARRRCTTRSQRPRRRSRRPCSRPWRARMGCTSRRCAWRRASCETRRAWRRRARCTRTCWPPARWGSRASQYGCTGSGPPHNPEAPRGPLPVPDSYPKTQIVQALADTTGVCEITSSLVCIPPHRRSGSHDLCSPIGAPHSPRKTPLCRDATTSQRLSTNIASA